VKVANHPFKQAKFELFIRTAGQAPLNRARHFSVFLGTGLRISNFVLMLAQRCYSYP
jgi:hypothetical protein